MFFCSASTSSCSALSAARPSPGSGAAYNLVRVLVKLVQSFWQAAYPTLSRLRRQASSRYALLSALSLRYGLLLLLPAAALCRRRR